MADCPVCGSNLQVVKYRWLTNKLGLTHPYFICPACDWRMTTKEVHAKGGLHRIHIELTYGKPDARGQPSRRGHRPRHRRHHR